MRSAQSGAGWSAPGAADCADGLWFGTVTTFCVRPGGPGPSPSPGPSIMGRAMTDFAQPLREEDADPDPVRQFRAWFQAAADVGVRMPEAAAVATAANDGAPSVRMVLVKEADEDGFVFYTNYESRKARELA